LAAHPALRATLSPRAGRGAFLVAILLLATSLFAETSATPPQLPGKVGIDQHLDAQLPLDTMFRDETGRVVRLREYADGSKPILLRSEEHTSELQSLRHLVCRLLLEKKK